ncbi:MAG: NAD-glutamate dehydrogenase, partial [Alphaproteobacteria bacterium]|nr:NAD-glutamate dehydrogenase [Alphaproteobacteria bacterium]
ALPTTPVKVSLATQANGGLAITFSGPTPLPLVRAVLLLEGCGLYAIHSESSTQRGLTSQTLHTTPLASKPNKAQLQALQAVLQSAFQPETEQDSLNRLALLMAAQPEDLLLLRALVAYLQQLNRNAGPRRTRHLLWGNPALTQGLLEIFKARLQPRLPAAARAAAKRQQAKLEQAIAQLPNAEEEQLWRTLLGMVLATLRTNAWSRQPNEALALKVNPSLIGSVVGPHPWREIFVYHPAVEGVHLRGGPVARGGLRHSNRAADYRTEVLGLMTAQMRKNTIIIPVGAKGGFYLRGAAPEGVSAKEWAVTNYRRYIRALLSVSDTRNAAGDAVHPVGVRCLDGADPYLVVAADKGTATYSDFANAESQAANYWGLPQPGFWLGDAFASGGSAGYDHKQLAITARGAWISVLHHAGALGLTPSAKRPLRMVGIGDMAGDVFGNGLLMSPHVKLIAAFNHAQIFLDPTPDPAKSYAERQRCFKAGVAWDGYNPKLLSTGGGIFARSAKSIPLSAAAQQALGIKAKNLSPDALIQAILAAPVDALWNGGIGTFIKATDEPHAAAQDKANDATRIDAKAFRAAIIGEGGNLGLTPRARVELAKRGVRLNTDALDNSAGVDTSDHEVNLKILLAQAEANGQLTRPKRDTLLKSLTDEVCTLVLRDNHAQNLLISLEAAASPDDHAELMGWQETLVKQGYADMALDCLPARKDLQARPGGAYTRPELAALVAASKAWLRSQLLQDRDLLASPVAAPLLRWYFPAALHQPYAKAIHHHPLAAEITATMLANLIINRLGLLAVPRLMADHAARATDAARALALGCCVARLTSLWQQLDALQEGSKPLDTPAQVAAYARLKLVATFLGSWLLRQGQPVDLAAGWQTFFGPLGEALQLLPKALQGRPEIAAWQTEWQAMGLPPKLAQGLALLSPLVVVPDAIEVAAKLKQPLAKVLSLHLQLGSALQLPALVGKIRTMPVPDSFTRQAIQALVLELFMRQRRLTTHLLRNGQTVAAWRANCGRMCGRYELLVRQLLREKHLTVAMLTLLLARLRELEN